MRSFAEQVTEYASMLCAHAGAMFVQVSLLIVLLLLLDFPLQRYTRATVRYWIWALVLAKLATPASLSFPTGISYWLARAFPQSDAGSEMTGLGVAVSRSVSAATDQAMAVRFGASPHGHEHNPAAQSRGEEPEVAVQGTFQRIVNGQVALLFCWLLGTCSFGWLALRRCRLVSRLIDDAGSPAPHVSRILETCRAELGLRRMVRVRVSREMASPAVCGLLRPTILLPLDFSEQLSEEQVKGALMHELAHIKRGDLGMNLIQTLLQILYFYNPLVWVANSRIRRIREQAADELTLVALGNRTREYMQTLIMCAARMSGSSRSRYALGFIQVAASRSAVAERIRHMVHRPLPKSGRLGPAGFLSVAAAALVLLPMASAPSRAGGTVSGPVRIIGAVVSDGVTGRPAKPFGWAGERVFLSQWDADWGVGGETLGKPVSKPPGGFVITHPSKNNGFEKGRYSLFTLGFDAAMAFSCSSRLQMPADVLSAEGVTLTLPAHYSVMYDPDTGDWGDTPWISGDDFYQTFVATGPHITRIAARLASKSGDHEYLTLNYAVYAVGEGDPASWKRISPVRSRFLSRGTDPIMHILWVPYRSTEIQLKAGRTYAIRLWRDASSLSKSFALLVRRDAKDGYAAGHLFQGNTPREDLDAYLYVSGGSPQTLVNHIPTGDVELKQLVGSATRFGQTFRASGSSLAGAEVIYTTGEVNPAAMAISFQVYDGLNGRTIGPARICHGLPLAFQGRAAVSWQRGQVPLKPGREYYLEWVPSRQCNTWCTNEDLPGEAVRDGAGLKGLDLVMCLAEYE